MDTQTIRMNALNAAWGLDTTAMEDRLAGQLQAQSGINNSMGSLLGGVTSAYGLGTNWGRNPFSWTMGR